MRPLLWHHRATQLEHWPAAKLKAWTRGQIRRGKTGEKGTFWADVDPSDADGADFLRAAVN